MTRENSFIIQSQGTVCRYQTVMYKNLKEKYISVSGVGIFLRIRGDGPPYCLYMVTPKLSDYFTLICPDI